MFRFLESKANVTKSDFQILLVIQFNLSAGKMSRSIIFKNIFTHHINNMVLHKIYAYSQTPQF